MPIFNNISSGGNGASGYSGYPGSQGIAGLGISGYSGIGVSGYSGYSGVGTSGYSGKSGVSGISGWSGASATISDPLVIGTLTLNGTTTTGVITADELNFTDTTFINYLTITASQSILSGEGNTITLDSSGANINATTVAFTNSSMGFFSTTPTSQPVVTDDPSLIAGLVGLGLISSPSFTGGGGASGYSGISGKSGYSGSNGLSGFSGYSGTNGLSGFSGTSGFSGKSGFSGISGFSGYSGKSGFSGYSGSGLSGFSGYSGAVAVSGFSGYSGKSGFSGYSGIANTYPLQTLTFSTTQAWDMSAGPYALLTLTANTTFSAPTNLTAGAGYVLALTQDGTGSRTITWNSAFKWSGGTAPTLSTAASAKDLITFTSPDGTNLYGVFQGAFS